MENSRCIIFGNNIAKYRKLKNMTQEELAEKLDFNSQAVSKWENGKCFPRLKIIIRICNELEINYNDLFKELFK